MSTRTVQGLAPWPQHQPPARLRPDAIFLCAYEVHFGVDTNTEVAFLQRPDGREELAILLHPDDETLDRLLTRALPAGAQVGIAGTASRQPDAVGAARLLLGALFEARTGFAWPVSLSIPGLVDDRAFGAIVTAAARRLNARARRAALLAHSEIVKTADVLRLRPEPSGTESSSWRANCPGTQHFLMIDAARGLFACGWCGRHGGPQELRAFAERRRAAEAARRGGCV